MELFIILACGFMNIACFIAGAKIGQKVSRGEPIETPNLNPVQVIREHKDKKAAEYEQDRIATIMENIENYDGTSNNQKDVPRG